MLPVSPHDETSNKGAANVLISMLLAYGILEIKSDNDNNNNSEEEATDIVHKLQLCDGYEKRYLLIVGDGLTQIRIDTFRELIEESSYRFGKRYEISNILTNAMNQIIPLPGDLHGGCFHFLGAIYTLFYGCIIQPVQTSLLGWKRIKGSDVTKCYQQAAGLVLMISDEIERHLVCEFLLGTKDMFIDTDHPEEFAIQIAKDCSRLNNRLEIRERL